MNGSGRSTKSAIRGPAPQPGQASRWRRCERRWRNRWEPPRGVEQEPSVSSTAGGRTTPSGIQLGFAIRCQERQDRTDTAVQVSNTGAVARCSWLVSAASWV